MGGLGGVLGGCRRCGTDWDVRWHAAARDGHAKDRRAGKRRIRERGGVEGAALKSTMSGWWWYNAGTGLRGRAAALDRTFQPTRPDMRSGGVKGGEEGAGLKLTMSGWWWEDAGTWVRGGEAGG